MGLCNGIKKVSIYILRIRDKHHYMINVIDYWVEALKSCTLSYYLVRNSRWEGEEAIEKEGLIV